MILIVIVIVSVIQILAYRLVNKIGLKYGQAIIFLLVLSGHFYFLPKLFYPEPGPEGVNCGMPILGITMAFWIFGGLAAIFIHVIKGVRLKKTA